MLQERFCCIKVAINDLSGAPSFRQKNLVVKQTYLSRNILKELSWQISPMKAIFLLLSIRGVVNTDLFESTFYLMIIADGSFPTYDHIESKKWLQ